MDTMTATADEVSQNPAEVQGRLLRACMLREMRYAGLLKNIIAELAHVDSLPVEGLRKKLQSIHREVLLALDSDSLDHFEHIFESMHGGYLQRLAHEFPLLTPTELRLAAFLRLPMPSKEVARLFSCSVRSIEKHRERMRRKFDLEPKENLTTFLASRA